MIRSAFFAMAVAAMVFSVDAALAGGRSGGSSKSNNQYVRIKNNGSNTALVNAANGTVSTSGARSLASNGVTQFNLKKSAGQAIAANTSGITSPVLAYSFPKSTYVYLLAKADASAATITFSPAGKTF